MILLREGRVGISIPWGGGTYSSWSTHPHPSPATCLHALSCLIAWNALPPMLTAVQNHWGKAYCAQRTETIKLVTMAVALPATCINLYCCRKGMQVVKATECGQWEGLQVGENRGGMEVWKSMGASGPLKTWSQPREEEPMVKYNGAKSDYTPWTRRKWTVKGDLDARDCGLWNQEERVIRYMRELIFTYWLRRLNSNFLDYNF